MISERRVLCVHRIPAVGGVKGDELKSDDESVAHDGADHTCRVMSQFQVRGRILPSQES